MLQYTQHFWLEGASGSHLVPRPSHMKADHQVSLDHSELPPASHEGMGGESTVSPTMDIFPLSLNRISLTTVCNHCLLSFCYAPPKNIWPCLLCKLSSCRDAGNEKARASSPTFSLSTCIKCSSPKPCEFILVCQHLPVLGASQNWTQCPECRGEESLPGASAEVALYRVQDFVHFLAASSSWMWL